MKKSEIFASVLQTVSKITEIPAENILSCDKTIETVDARFLLAKVLFDSGFYPGEIARFMSRTKAGIRYLLSCFDDRIRSCRMMEINMEYIRRELEKNNNVHS